MTLISGRHLSCSTFWLRIMIMVGLCIFGIGSGTTAETEAPSAAPVHSRGFIKGEDVLRARENVKQSAWARDYLEELRKECDPLLEMLSPSYLEDMIPQTTPLSTLLTPCPACRDAGKPQLAHGKWKWDAKEPNRQTCGVCGTTFPNEKHPESVVLHSTWGKPQTFTFDGGKTFSLFRYKTFRPSISGNLRARKVDWMIRKARKLGELYALTGKPDYARATRKILLRLAEVYPYWLVHSGYGEFADMDPKIAAEAINNLPADELVYPPNKPDRALFTGYWTAGRASGIGLEGIWVEFFTTAYDLTNEARDEEGNPIYSEEDKRTIRENLLKESVVLLQADKVINNKSINNRSAAGLVGMVTGDPELVRFGIEGFDKLVNTWFLPDGGTPESPAYALMSLDGAAFFAQALRGYTDPEGYRDAKGKRYDHFDPYRETHYPKIWEGMFKSLQGDLYYPPIADSYNRKTMLGSKYAELMADNYPERPEYQALLKAYAGDDWADVYAPYAIYFGKPGREKEKIPSLVLPSNCLPDLKIGFMRTGTDGRESLLALSASDWGEHHHEDSLNLYYWKQGEELLSDLGYLWDHPKGNMTLRTFAHNVVIVNLGSQATVGRGGEVRYFLNRSHVRAMRASSKAYARTSLYERASTLVDHGKNRDYVVDVFWVQGGQTQDYVYHGPNQKFESNAEMLSKGDRLYDLAKVRRIPSVPGEPWKLEWKITDKLKFTAWNLPVGTETAFLGDGWGQRNSSNEDMGTTLPYIVRRTRGDAPHAFVSVFEGHPPGDAFVRNVRLLPAPDGTAPVVVLQIDTADSRDYVLVSSVPQDVTVQTLDGSLQSRGALLAVVSIRDGSVLFSETDSGSVQLVPAAEEEGQ